MASDKELGQLIEAMSTPAQLLVLVDFADQDFILSSVNKINLESQAAHSLKNNLNAVELAKQHADLVDVVIKKRAQEVNESNTYFRIVGVCICITALTVI